VARSQAVRRTKSGRSVLELVDRRIPMKKTVRLIIMPRITLRILKWLLVRVWTSSGPISRPWPWLIALGLLTFSCATTGVQMRESGPRPAWVQDAKDWWEEKGEFRFRGRVENADDAALGLREAEAEAVKMVAERLRMTVRTEFSAYAKRVGMSGAATTKLVSDGIAWVSRDISVTGVHPVASWYRAALREGYTAPIYECHRLVAISKGDYEAARQEVLRRIAEAAGEAGNREMEEAAREMMEKVEGGE
jgi:hypothetical protein